MIEEVLSLCNGRLKKFGDYDFFQNIQVLTPTKKGALGTKELNKSLQEILNPHDDRKKEKNSFGVIFRHGDRVMQIKNNYDIFWERWKQNDDDDEATYETGNGVFNGEIGRVTKINELEKTLTSSFLHHTSCEGPIFIEVQVRKGNRKDLGRPTTTPIQNKEALMQFLKK